MAAGDQSAAGRGRLLRQGPRAERGPGTPRPATVRICEWACPGAVTSARTVRAGTTEGGMTRRSARAERQQKFLTNRFVDLVEIQRRLAFIAQHFQYGRAAFLRD